MRARWGILGLLLVAPASRLQAQSAYEELQRFSEVLTHIRNSYADSVTQRQLVRAAIDGVLRSLDPHSWFQSREDYLRFSALERGELAVTGIALELADGVPTVMDVVDRSPADRAGVLPGDRLLAVGGQPTAGLTAQAITLLLAGKKDSKVPVTLERGPRLDPDSVSVTLKREMAKPSLSVLSSRMVDPSTGYLRLGEFGTKSSDEVRKAIRNLRGQKADRLILDLRGNPGGLVIEAVSMASAFFPEKTLVFSTRGRKQAVNEEFRTKTAGDFCDLPLVVLIDNHSASASEALAATLQDHDRAVVAGRRSFGKALMQGGFDVPDGYIRLTIGHIVSPSGRYIQRPYTGMRLEQYYAFAGDSAWQDTSRSFRTDGGRLVKGGGGVAPDVALPAPATMPRWFTVAADSGWDQAVADSIAFTLGGDAAARAAWRGDEKGWSERLLPPLLNRVRSRLHLAAEIDAATGRALARRLAVRAASVRWGDEAGDELAMAADPDVAAARALFDRMDEILGPRATGCSAPKS